MCAVLMCPDSDLVTPQKEAPSLAQQDEPWGQQECRKRVSRAITAYTASQEYSVRFRLAASTLLHFLFNIHCNKYWYVKHIYHIFQIWKVSLNWMKCCHLQFVSVRLFNVSICGDDCYSCCDAGCDGSLFLRWRRFILWCHEGSAERARMRNCNVTEETGRKQKVQKRMQLYSVIGRPSTVNSDISSS